LGISFNLLRIVLATLLHPNINHIESNTILTTSERIIVNSNNNTILNGNRKIDTLFQLYEFTYSRSTFLN
jgi:hypothetical protein